jgi:acetolactate synthase-1/2/3 large subunit
MRVVDYIADELINLGSNTWFVLTGNGSMYINDAIAKRPEISTLSARNEAAAPMMAEGYSRLSGKLGVVCVTAGPGATNSIPGLAEAYWDSAPIIVLSGQSPVSQVNEKVRSYGTAGFNVLPSVEKMTKYAVMIDDKNNVRYEFEKAVYLALNGRPGPVWIDLPMDIQSAEIDPSSQNSYDPESGNSLDCQELINTKVQEVLKNLSNAKNPLILLGNGIRQSNSIDKCRELIEFLEIPFITSRFGKDLIPKNHNLNFGQPGLKGELYSPDIMGNCDYLLCLGSRMPVQMVGENIENFKKDITIDMVDIDIDEIFFHEKNINLSINCCLSDAISSLLAKKNLFKKSENLDDWLNYCNDLKIKKNIETKINYKNPIDLYLLMSKLDSLSKENDVFITDAGSNYYVGGQVYNHNKKGQREISAVTSAAMGLSIPLSIGAACADRSRLIIAVTGDGSLELNIQELKTISFYGLNIKLFVINNGGYLSMKKWQDNFFEGRRIGTGTDEDVNDMLDLEKVAAAYDVHYSLIKDYKTLDEDIKKIFNSKGPQFIEVICDHNQEIIHPFNETSTVLS